MVSNEGAVKEEGQQEIPRQTMQVDVVGVGYGPAMAGFLTTLSRGLLNDDGSPRVESQAMPGMPLQVLCYERADDLGFGVSGIVTRARGIRASYPDFDPSVVPLATAVKSEKLFYLLDPLGASRRSTTLKLADKVLRGVSRTASQECAFELPYIPSFMQKHDGLLLSMGQFMQWTAGELMTSGLVQIWPGMPVERALVAEGKVCGVRLLDQGTDREGNPTDGFMPGMDIQAALTVVADGPVGAVGKQLEEQFGLPDGHHQREWAVGAKMLVELRDGVDLEPGTVLHTFGFPEPEIFGFLYVYPGNLVSIGIFVPSTFPSPVRSSYRYLQHWMSHPAVWKYLEGGTLRSWGAKSLQESGRLGEPRLAGDGYARIGEGSGSTNVLTGSGVDEAWTTGSQLAEAVLELASEGKPFTEENLEQTYVRRRRASWVEKEGRIAEKARDGFRWGFLWGMLGMGLSGLSGGRLSVPAGSRRLPEYLSDAREFFKGKIPAEEIEKIREECRQKGITQHDALMTRAGWPEIAFDGKLLMSLQDALLLGGKVQAAPGFADHVQFVHPELCEHCQKQVCVEMCSGEAITPGEGGRPNFDREKCVHCGACFWNCSQATPENPEKLNIRFRSGSGGLHSSEN